MNTLKTRLFFLLLFLNLGLLLELLSGGLLFLSCWCLRLCLFRSRRGNRQACVGLLRLLELLLKLLSIYKEQLHL